MLVAIHNNERVFATEGGVGYCPECHESLIPACGDIYIHHWRHKPESICTYGAGETTWHRRMKSLFPIECVEVRHGVNRSDVLLQNGTAIEFQNSSISITDIKTRRMSVDRMIWMFNLEKQADRDQLSVDGNMFWYNRPKEIFHLCMPHLFWYCSDEMILKVNYMNDDIVYDNVTGYNKKITEGRCEKITLTEFVERAMKYDEQFKQPEKPPEIVQLKLFNINPQHD